MKWLITGGCGFIGSNLANSLIRDGEDVYILDNLSRNGSRENLGWLRGSFGDNFFFSEGDIRDSNKVDHFIKTKKPDVIVHLAGQVAMTTSIANPRLDFEVNAQGTFNVLESVRTYSPSSIILYSSTNKVYGSLDYLRFQELETRYILPDYPNGLGEGLPIDGHSPYGCSKLSGDQYVHDYYRIYGIQTVVFRHSSMYGGRQFATYDQGWIGWFCQKSIEQANPNAKAFSINGNGKQVRDVLYADDLIQVYRMAVANISAIAGNIYNIGGGMSNSLSLLELFNILNEINGYSLHFFNSEWRLGDQKVFVADTTCAQNDFKWTPHIDKKTGIARMLSWCREMSAND